VSEAQAPVETSTSWATRFARGRVTALVGVIGLAMTLLGALDPLIQIAELAQALVRHWHEAAHYIWSLVFSFWKLNIGPVAAARLTAASFLLAVSISSMRSNAGPKSLLVWMWAKLLVFAMLLFLAILIVGSAESRLSASDSNGNSQTVIYAGWIFAAACLVAFLSNPFSMIRRLFDSALMVGVLLALSYSLHWLIIARDTMTTVGRTS